MVPDDSYRKFREVWTCDIRQRTDRKMEAYIQTRSLQYFSPLKVKGKGFPYSTPSVGPGADPGVQAVSQQVTVSHPSDRYSL